MEYRRRSHSQRLHPPDRAILEGVTFTGCKLGGSAITGHARRLEDYPCVRDCRLVGCRLDGCLAHAVRFEDCTLQGGAWADVMVVDECVFSRVVLDGRLGALNLVRRQRDLRPAYRRIDWALDIRGVASKSLSIVGIPARLIQRDPAVHGVITRARVAAVPDWEAIVGRSLAGLVIADLLADPWSDDTLYIVGPGPRRARHLQELARLREAGLAEPD